jgi:gas vesicle protein
MSRIDLTQAAGLFLAGGMVGAAVAILYAPQSGVRTRKDIRRLAGSTVDRLDALQGAIREQLQDWIDDVTEVVQDGAARGSQIGAEGREHVLQSFDSAKKHIEEGRGRIEQLIGPREENV